MRILVEFWTEPKINHPPRYYRYFKNKDQLCRYLIEEDGNYTSYKIIAEKAPKRHLIGLD